MAGKAGNSDAAASVAVNPNTTTPPARVPRSATASGNVVTYVYNDGTTHTLTGHHPNRDNNPANITYLGDGSYARSLGAIGNDNGFAIFPSIDQGFAATAKNMGNIARIHVGKANRSRQPDGTIAAIVYTWTPLGQPGNDPEKIIGELYSWTGISRNTQFSSLTDTQKIALAHAYARAEGFHPN
jgi:hypothetical protein